MVNPTQDSPIDPLSFSLFSTGMNSSKTKLELQKHLTTLTNQEQATIFEEVQVQSIVACSRKAHQATCLWSVLWVVRTQRASPLPRGTSQCPVAKWVDRQARRQKEGHKLSLAPGNLCQSLPTKSQDICTSV